ncbi:hypothetical protein BD626DRAFT_484681 [Schizophyllum amplum]|uniref:Uncharacterized protein n=1 Tax=Schizophyllum amplum TaxID=97359 RepID=A0A550CQJ4_9AGAR|nr:hypothetical protein BD626DRAFT_484681 [Auriculariopsis ampla]
MPDFVDIPVELYEEILAHLIKASHLASASLVNKTFYSFATPLLYEQIYIYHWHGQSKVRVIKLFGTLSRCPHLAKYVKKLVLTGPPKIVAADSEDLFTLGLRNCKDLRACTWTRDGALTSGVLEALQYCSLLSELEINGRSEYNYRPDLLRGFRRLRHITLIMPDAGVVNQLQSWMSYTGDNLRRLTLICKASPLINDSMLDLLAPHLTQLEHFSLVGCPKVTHKGMWDVISKNMHGIRSLGLEGLSTRFDMDAFASLCSAHQTLAHLSSITLTVNQHIPIERFTSDTLSLLANCPLERVHIYSTGVVFESSATDEFCLSLIATHGAQLRRFAVYKMILSMRAIDATCELCPQLEQLFVVVEKGSLMSLASSLAKAPQLRSVHVNFPQEANTPIESEFIEAGEALQVVAQCGPALRQFGCNTKVWQVERRIEKKADGSDATRTYLGPYEKLEVPEQFLVVRA